MKAKVLIVTITLLCLTLAACSPQRLNDNLSSNPAIGKTESGESNSIPQSTDEANNTSIESEKKQNIEEKSLYSLENSPFFDISFDKIEKIYFYNAAMGEEQTITSYESIENIIAQWKSLQFYDEVPATDPTLEGLSHECLYYFEFYEAADDDAPIFCAGLNPFYIKLGEEKYGPYMLDNEQIVAEVLNAID